MATPPPILNIYNLRMLIQKIVNGVVNLHETVQPIRRLRELETDDYLLVFREHTSVERWRSLLTPATRVFDHPSSGAAMWIGNAFNAGDPAFFRQNEIKLCVNATREVPNHFADTAEYLQVSVHDVSADAENIWKPEIARRAATVLEEGGNVFVHCYMGRSRSVALALQIISMLTGQPLDDIYIRLKRRRPIISIQTCFYRVLERRLAATGTLEVRP